MSEPSRPWEVLLPLSRSPATTLRRQLEDGLRHAVRDGKLGPGARLPSTRALASGLGVSRGVVNDAYEQLALEGVLELRPRAAPRIAASLHNAAPLASSPSRPRPRHDFTPTSPDVTMFPRADWRRAWVRVLHTAPDVSLDYADPLGVAELRRELSGYLGRARGVASSPSRIVIVAGYTQALRLICGVLVKRGIGRVAVEDPCLPEQLHAFRHAGLEIVPVPVDERGIVLEPLQRARVGAVVVSPAHQFPTGAVLAPERRREILAWAQRQEVILVEDDYDAEFRYDRRAVGALQGMLPDAVIYTGTASKSLAPGLRLGWLVVPEALFTELADEKRVADAGCPTLDQLVYADVLSRGVIDRHLQRARTSYRRRRNCLTAELARRVPGAQVGGTSAGLHLVLTLPWPVTESRLARELDLRSVRAPTLRSFRLRPADAGVDALVLGYGLLPCAAIPAAVAALAGAVEAARAGEPAPDHAPPDERSDR